MHYLVNAIVNWAEFSSIFDFKFNLLERIEKHQRYRRTVSELSSLSDMELNDIGIHRGMIRSIAREIYTNDM